MIKKSLTIILFLFGLSLICNAQTEIGIGVVSIDFDNKPTVLFYKNPTDKNPTKTIEFFDDQSTKSLNIKNLEAQKKWLKPEALWLDYSSFIFRCKSKIPNWYEVIVNNETGKSLWLKKSNFIKLLSWETHLRDKYVIERSANYKQPIRKLPSDNSSKIKYSGQDCFQVKSMRGEWLEIFTSNFCQPAKTTIKSGWIKWRNGNRLLIKYLLAD